MTRPLGREVRRGPRYGDYYVARASDRKYAIRIAGGRSLGVLGVSTHNSAEEARAELRRLREGGL